MGKKIKFTLLLLGFAIIITVIIYFAIDNINFLNTNAGVVNLIFSAIVALSTLVYALLTWSLVNETKEMREAQTEPSLAIIFEPREELVSFINIRIQNIGMGGAYNISFKVNPDVKFDGKYLSEISFLKKINYLAPHQKMESFFTSLLDDFKEKITSKFQIIAKYENKAGKRYTETFDFDFSQWESLSQLGEPPAHSIAKHIERIQKDIGSIASGFKKIKVEIFTQKEIKNINKKFLKSLEAHKKKFKQ